jgi:uncharacterized protein
MRSLIFIFVLVFNCTSAQEITQNIKTAFDTDNAQLLVDEMKAKNYDWNSCFTVKENTYNLLAIAIKLNAVKIFDALIEKVDVNKHCDDKTMLMYCAKYDNLDFFKKLVGKGVNLEEQGEKGRTAYDYAVHYKATRVLEFYEQLKKQ